MIAVECLHELGHDQRKLRLQGLFHRLHLREEASFLYAQWVLGLLGLLDYRP